MPPPCCRRSRNTDYEGEIQNQGDRVKIRTKPTITIRDYLADGLLGLDRPSGGSVELYIGIGKYFSLILDDVMEVQSDLNLLSMWSDDAAQQLKIVVDRDVLGGIVGRRAAKNKGATAGIISGNINLGIKGTPLAVNARTDRRSGRHPRHAPASRPGAGRAEHPGDGTLGGDVGGCRPLHQAVRTPAGLSVWRSGVDAAQRPARHGRPVHHLHLQFAPQVMRRTATNFAAGEQPIFAGHAHGITFACQIQRSKRCDPN